MTTGDLGPEAQRTSSAAAQEERRQLRFRTHFFELLAVVPVIIAVLALPVSVAAQDRRYKVIDLGTLGGLQSGQVLPGRNINNRGEAIAVSETFAADPYSPNCFETDCLVAHAIKWDKGLVNVLRTPASIDRRENSSLAVWLANTGWTVGLSENGLLDPLTGFPQFTAVLWKKHGRGLDLGTLGGNSSQAFSVNDLGQVVGVALNNIPDDFATYMNFVPAATQAHAFLWQDGLMQDLGTLGGTDSNAQAINDHGQVLGFSYTDSSPNPFFGVPTVHPFLWQNGKMEDLGSLGGTVAVPGSLFLPGGVNLNARGQVVGTSTLTGDQVWHPFLWEHGSLKDLGTLGGNNGEALFVSDSGYVVGRTDVSVQNNIYHAFRWKNDRMIDLGVFPPCRSSVAFSVNSSGQVVGETQICPGGVDGHAFLSQHGETMVDLNTLVMPRSELTVRSAAFISNRGEIIGLGTLQNGEERAVLLLPCDDDHPNVEGCDYSDVESAATQSHVPVPAAIEPIPLKTSGPATLLDSLRSRSMSRRRMSGQRP